MSDIAGKTIYITGGTSGIGLAVARQLATRGAHIALLSRLANAAALASVAAACRSPEQRVAHYALDVADREAVITTILTVAGEFGAPDILINSAGFGTAVEFVDMPYEDFDQMMRINLYGTRNVVEAVLPFMLERPGSTIVLVASMAGFVPVFGYTAYGASKFAVVGFAQCLRYELKPRGIDVVCFCPGEVETPGLSAEAMTVHPAAAAMKKIGGKMQPDSAARALVTGIERGRFLVVPGVRTRIVYWLLRLTPLPLWNAVTDMIVARALRGHQTVRDSGANQFDAVP